MANGDKAASKGWTTYAQTQGHNQGFDNTNYTLDRVADEVDARAAAIASVRQDMGVTKFIVTNTMPTAPYVSGAAYIVTNS